MPLAAAAASARAVQTRFGGAPATAASSPSDLRSVAHARPCELIVHDAYHRVLHRELIDGHQTEATSSSSTADKRERR